MDMHSRFFPGEEKESNPIYSENWRTHQIILVTPLSPLILHDFLKTSTIQLRSIIK